MGVDFEDPTGTVSGYPDFWEEPIGRDITTVIPAGQRSTQMVDLYKLPVNDLVEEIHRLVALNQTKDTILEAGKRANQDLKNRLQQIRSLTNF